jgi:hypothetical protein
MRIAVHTEAKTKCYKACADWKAGLSKPSQYLNVYLASYPVDEPFDVMSVGKSKNAIHALIATLQRYEVEIVTPRMLGEKMAFCGFGPMPVGTPDMVTDVMEDWANNGDVDEFNIACECLPASMVSFQTPTDA